jgi:predicted ABC-type ATPase
MRSRWRLLASMAAKKSSPKAAGALGPAEITVLAGVNGAGKSSIGGAYLRENGAEYFNPDEVARLAMEASPGLSQRDANAYAWTEGKRRLEAAIATGAAFAFETTLGGSSIATLLEQAAINGAVLRIWFAGLASVDQHIGRVAARVERGGHDIPESDIRRRWVGSHANLIRLIPHVTDLRVFDNSAERDLAKGAAPEPRLLLAIDGKQLSFPLKPADLAATPQWAKPIVFAAYQHFGLTR